MQIYLIRHGSTPGNLEHRYVGSTDEPLTEEAKALLSRSCSCYPVADKVVTSGMLRCNQTASILFPGAKLCRNTGLKECEFGDFEYKNYKELDGNADYQAWIDSGGTLAFPDGESREAFVARCQEAFLEEINKAQAEGVSSLAFVVHGGTIMAVLDGFSDPHKDYFDWQVKNGCGFACTWIPDMSVSDRISLIDMISLPYEPERIGIEDAFVMKKNKKLRCGFTTGSCASAAAKAAARMLLTQKVVRSSALMTPKGIALKLPLEAPEITKDHASCAVRKFAGDDPDATDGILVFARAEWTDGSEIVLDGGTGVGRVTKPGLEQPVGAAAINRVPRQMIRAAVQEICEEQEYEGGMKITISVPEGIEIARKTFNPHIGIMGGISILGTSGIVVPMSEEALIASIRLEMKQKIANGEECLLIVPGNYGADFIRKKERSASIEADQAMKCSNYVGETVDMAVELGAKGILFIAHIGKFIKVSGGIMNTHSAHADCRAELMAAQAMRAGADAEVVERLLGTNTTEEAVGILKEEHLDAETMKEAASRIHFHLQKRCQGAIRTEVILYSNQFGYLGETDGAEALLEEIIEQNKKGVDL